MAVNFMETAYPFSRQKAILYMRSVHARKACQVIRRTLRRIIGCLFAWDAGQGCSDFWRLGEMGAVAWRVAGLPGGRQAGVTPVACPERQR